MSRNYAIRVNDLEEPPLVVDLDGTLVRTDLLVESIFQLLKQNLLYFFALPIWLLKGKAHFKEEIAARVDIDAGLLPYNDLLLKYLKSERARGRRLILATASSEKLATPIAAKLDIFDEVLASNGEVNLSGRRKLECLRNLYGDGGFDYAANSFVDLPIWEAARSAILVNPETSARRAVERQGRISRIFDDRNGSLMAYVKAMRLHQWLKNLLVFIPLAMSHRLNEPTLVVQTVIAFFAFGFCASSVYLLNDLVDLPDDRRHATKRFRPFAAGSLPITVGVVLVPALLTLSLCLALFLPIEFIAALGVYYLGTLLYSFRLKRVALVDVLTLAGLYTMRIIGGAAAVSVMPSFWLLAFSMFLFLSLALVKRYTELLSLQGQTLNLPSGRGYRVSDLDLLSQFGTASGYLAVLVLALYINSEAVRRLYTHPEVIWLLCPLLLYMVTRLWLLGHRGELDEDPVVFVIRDRRSQLLAGIGAILLWLAT